MEKYLAMSWDKPQSTCGNLLVNSVGAGTAASEKMEGSGHGPQKMRGRGRSVRQISRGGPEDILKKQEETHQKKPKHVHDCVLVIVN
jgi:hypothetical protein